MKVTRRTRLQSRLNSLLFLILLLFAVGLLAWLSTRYSTELDWTASGRHTLSDASARVLKELEMPIKITAYARDEAQLRDAIRTFVARYQRTKPDITLEFINPDIAPDLVRELGISVNGELVVRYDGRSENVKNITEENLTNALHRLARGAERWLVFMEGHGERHPLGDANHDLSEWTRQLGTSGYHIQPLNLQEAHSLPDNTAVLVIAGPRVELFPGVVDMIREYVNEGGNLLWLLDPGKLHGLEPLAYDLGLELPDGVIVDFAGQLLGISDPTTVLVTPTLYGQHAITRGLEYTTLFPLARALDTYANSDWEVTPIIKSGNHTWLETAELIGEIDYDEETAEHGPYALGLALERAVLDKDDLQRVVVIGDGDFLSNTYVHNGGNLQMGTRIVNWLSTDDQLIDIPPKIAPDTVLELPNTAAVIIGFGFLFVLPIAFFTAGLTIWWRRRKR